MYVRDRVHLSRRSVAALSGSLERRIRIARSAFLSRECKDVNDKMIPKDAQTRLFIFGFRQRDQQ